jgi:Putative esterase
MPGSPWSYINSLSLGNLGDTLIARHLARPFIAVMPVAGRTGHYDGQWAGRWEDYLVRRVVPWADAHLPTIAAARGRTLAGRSAGGYFSPRADLPVADPGPVAAAAHDPRLLVRREAPLLRRRGTSFFLSTGPGHGRVDAHDTIRFARELRDLRLPYRMELFSRARGAWKHQLDAGLRWALARVSR